MYENTEAMGMYGAIILRDPDSYLGQGRMFFLYLQKDKEAEIVTDHALITGSTTKDPYALGGIMPPIFWHALESCKRRKHPHQRRSHMTMARLYPALQEELEEFASGQGSRTFDAYGPYAFPFMFHAGAKKPGASTGCAAIIEEFGKSVDSFNLAFEDAQKKDYPFLILTRDIMDRNNIEGAEIQSVAAELHSMLLEMKEYDIAPIAAK